MTDAARTDVSRYYDLLHLWTKFNSGFRAFSGVESHAIHRWLIDPASGEFSPDTIHRIMLASGIGGNGPIDALDAGCGYGGTIFALQKVLGGHWHGLTISARQCGVARAAARRKGIADAVSFARGSYDEPPARRFSLIYGIESLIHSADPARTIAALAGTLAPGGTFVIVDDMPADHVPSGLAADLQSFKTLWRCPAMPTARQWGAHLDAAGCDVIDAQDLTKLMRPRAEPEVARAIEEVGARRRWRDRLGLRRIGEAETGGLLLERLGREGAVRYVMILARKRG